MRTFEIFDVKLSCDPNDLRTFEFAIREPIEDYYKITAYFTKENYSYDVREVKTFADLIEAELSFKFLSNIEGREFRTKYLVLEGNNLVVSRKYIKLPIPKDDGILFNVAAVSPSIPETNWFVDRQTTIQGTQLYTDHQWGSASLKVADDWTFSATIEPDSSNMKTISKLIGDYTKIQKNTIYGKQTVENMEEKKNMRGNNKRKPKPVIKFVCANNPGEYEEVKDASKVIRNVQFNVEKGITTIVWADGEITMAKCGPNDSFDYEKGVSIAFMKRFWLNSTQFNKWMHEKTEGCIEEKYAPKHAEKPSFMGKDAEEEQLERIRKERC